MEMNKGYNKSIELLYNCSSNEGFLASFQDVSNYQRVWARDGVICGLAALASNKEDLIITFEKTLQTLAANQHKIGTIPSNVGYKNGKVQISYGGLAGRVDSVTWFIIGVCQLAFYKDDASIVKSYKKQISKCLKLLNSWEFNNKHLLYVPLSGNWADEYITDGYVLYDQLLRLWALKCYNHFVNKKSISNKIINITEQIEANFLPDSKDEKFHERAYNEINCKTYLPCSFSPSGYKTQFDTFANSLSILMNIGSKDFQNKQIKKAFNLAKSTKMGLVPAFWPVINEDDSQWSLLKDNCKYEFRNYPFEFHNGGSWPMVNGFFGLALFHKSETIKANTILKKISMANSLKDFSFYENFNTDTKAPNGVAYCAWSAAAQILLHQTKFNNFKILV